MSGRSFSVGSYTRHVTEQEDPFTTRVRAFRDDSLDQLEDKFENWEAPQVKEAVEGLQRADNKTQIVNQNMATGDAFAAGHKEYVDNDANALLILNQMDTMFGKGLHPLEHFESAYEYLRTNTNFLKLNQAEVARQQKAADKARYDAQRAQSVTPSEDEMYSMPMEEIRMRDVIENQKRKERIALEQVS